MIVKDAMLSVQPESALAILNCVSNGSVEGGEWVGGIVGYASCSRMSVINCINYARVKATDKETSYAGGIVGYSSNDNTIMDCVNVGRVTATRATSNIYKSFAGAIAGYTVEDDYDGYYSAGIAIVNCYYKTAATTADKINATGTKVGTEVEFDADWLAQNVKWDMNDWSIDGNGKAVPGKRLVGEGSYKISLVSGSSVVKEETREYDEDKFAIVGVLEAEKNENGKLFFDWEFEDGVRYRYYVPVIKDMTVTARFGDVSKVAHVYTGKGEYHGDVDGGVLVLKEDGTLMWVNSTVVNGKYTYNGDDVLMLEFYNTIGEISGRVNSNGTISMTVEYGMSATVEYTFTKSDLTVFGEYFNEDGDSLTFSDGNVTLNSNKISLNADGVFDGGYKIGKVASADATSMTVKSPYGDYIFTLGDGTLTMNNGYSDIVLDKNVKVVFIAGEGYQAAIFYVAKVGADGKIDMGSFALEDPTMAAGYTFKGWFGQDDSTIEFDEDATFTQNTIFVSKIEKTGYVLTFKKSSSDSEPVVVVVDKATGKLAASQIPADLTYEDGSVFTGWYTTAGVKAVADLTITQDTTFIAKSVKESDYEGTWVSIAKGKEAVLVVADGKVTFGEISGVSYTFNADGSISYGKWGDGSAKYSFVLTNSGIKATYRHLDSMGEEFEDDVYELVTPKSAGLFTKAAGTYQYAKMESSILVIDANGIITKVGSSAPVYGFVIGTSASNLTVSYKSGYTVYNYTGCAYKIKYITINDKIYVKDVKSAVDYYNTDAGSIIEFTRMNGSKEEKLYTYKYNYLVTIEGTFADGEIVTVSYTDSEGAKSMIIKINGTNYNVAGAERGTYTSEGADNLVLDGFGTAKLGEAAETTYTVGGQGYIIIGDSAYVLEDGKYTVLTDRDGYQGSFTRSDSKSFSFTLDGFGGVIAKYYSYTYTGTYSINDSKTTLTIADCYSSFNGTYSLEEDANVLVSSDKVFIKNGYTVSSKLDALLGYWKSADGTHSIEIVKASSKVYVKLDGTVYTAKGNYNNSILTISVDGKSMTITKDGEGIAYAGADSSIALAAATLTFDVDTTKLEGTWELFDYYYYTFTFGADGKLVATRISDYGTHTETVNYTINENVVKFSFYYEDFICTLADGALAVVDDGVSIGSARKIADPIVELDAFEGTWKTADGKFTFTFDGKGTVTNEDGQSYAYTIASEKASFSAGGIDIECTISGNTLTASYDDGESPFTKTFTKEAAETLDAFAGTWVGKPFASEVTLVCDGKGSGTFAGNAIAYTVKGDTIEFECGGCACVVTKSGDKLSFTCDDSEYMPNFDLTKRA